MEALAESYVPVDSATIRAATEFLYALPDDIPSPEIVVEDDGAMAFDWTFGRRHAISVSVYANNRIGYAWINESFSGHAMASFKAGVVPDSVLQQIREIVDAAFGSQ
ncbi:MAG: hypothetical protein SFX74_10295 [Fimbriimonadaceae bacterium]|nr:hypothetical protein [Fimbriimonadaceae bacterium]